LGKSSGAVRRLRGFRSLEALLRTLLLHVGCGWSLRETAVQAKLAGIANVSDVTLLNRLRNAEDWLRQLCQRLWKDNGVDLQPRLQGRNVRLLDATVVREPGRTGSQWRIHYSLRLPTLERDYFDLTATEGEGAGEKFGRFRFRTGELVLADAGYCHPAGIAAVVEQQADVCVRLNPHALLCGISGASHFRCWNPWPGCAPFARVAKRWHGRKSGWRRNGERWISPETWQYAQYVLVFTTLSSASATARQVLECYRLRWQVELTFKRLKSIAQLGHVPKHDDQSTRAWLYGNCSWPC